jgi:putative flippase GtrA
MNLKNFWKKYQTIINNDRYRKYSQLLNFLIIGGFATLFDILLLLILKQVYPNDTFNAIGIDISINNCISFTTSSVANFVANKKLNFKNTHERYMYQYGHFFIIGIVGLIINSIVYGLLHHSWGMGIVISKIIAALVVVCWSFPANKVLTFGKKFE